MITILSSPHCADPRAATDQAGDPHRLPGLSSSISMPFRLEFIAGPDQTSMEMTSHGKVTRKRGA